MEVNFDGLVGPTHHYAGLAFGNVASQKNQHSLANPKQAALQGLQKMRWLLNQGLVQGVLPPHMRPNFAMLHQLGFQGKEQDVLTRVYKQAPHLLSMCSSASAMWTANAATIAPSADTAQGKLCITPANLVGNAHRSMEAATNTRLFQYVFSNSNYFSVNQPLPNVRLFSDEGAANHMRIATPQGKAFHIFVYGSDEQHLAASGQYPARQTRQASEALVRLQDIPQAQALLWQQTPQAIDAGVFHNDVIALSHDGVLLCHEQAFVDQRNALKHFDSLAQGSVNIVEVPEKQLTLQQAVASYLFNSQILTCAQGKLKMLLPLECQEQKETHETVSHFIQSEVGLDEIHYMDLRQSMKNGGGPACLRLRIWLTEEERNAMQGKLIVNAATLDRLQDIVERHYPDSLSLEALASWPFCQALMDGVKAIYGELGLPESLFAN